MILMTGATGKTANQAAKNLAANNIPVRALVRDADKAADLKACGVELVIGDASDVKAVETAMAGVQKLMILLPNGEQQQAMEKQLVDIAMKSGVAHIVKLSSMEAEPGISAAVPKLHWESEEYIRQSDAKWTFIKPNFFMQNLLLNARTISTEGCFSLPVDQGKTAMMDCRDTADLMSEILSSDGHENKSYVVSGPQLLTFHEVAQRMSRIIGRQIEFIDIPVETYRATLAPFLTNTWHLDAVCELMSGIATDDKVHTTNTFEKIMGRAPRSLDHFIKDHLAIFKGDV